MMRTYEAIFFDWDGTAVVSRDAPVDEVLPPMIRLLEKGVVLVVMSGTTYENIAQGKLHEYIQKDAIQNLYLGLGRGAFTYGFDRDGNMVTLHQIIPGRTMRVRIHELAFAVHRYLLEAYGYDTDIVFARSNYCKIDLLVNLDRRGKLYLQPRELELVDQNLDEHGYTGGIRGLIADTLRIAREMDLDVKATTDAKFLEVGLSTKGDNMDFNLKLVPFSRYGSYIAFSHLEKSDERQDGLYMRTVHGCGAHAGALHVIFRVELLHGGEAVPFKEVASPTVLRIETEGGYAEICIPEPKLVRIRGSGVGLRLTMVTGMFDNAIPRENHRWQVTSFATGTRYMLTPIKGQLVVDAPWSVDKSETVVADFVPDPDDGTFECAVEEFITVWEERDYGESFDACLNAVWEDYDAWLDRMPGVPREVLAAGELAAYVNWSCVVAPEGYLTRPAMLMSKNWMNSLWSWDNCFNAMALAYRHPELAWDQLMILVDNQDASGAFPDSVNDSVRHWSFCKPPIHGWALKWMMERTDFIDETRLAEVYEPLCRWTQWWFEYRDDDHDAIPQYNHGNDSGWDNSTVFEVGPPVEGPDLSAYIVIQMEVLSEVASMLGKTREADSWKSRARILLNLLLSHSWRGDRFVAPRSGDHEVCESESLMLFLPIVLGNRLPKRVLSKLIAGLKEDGRFLTQHGLATESPKSPLYQPDGYWRGPIWAPSTMIIVDGLAAVGEAELARELARRFCDMAARSGMAENYDAITGAGLRDRAYTWTSSVFLILAQEYLM